MQDVEFTIEEGKLWMLQTRNGKRTGFAAVNIALDMVKERLITRDEAILRIPAEDLSHLLSPIFDSAAEKKANQDRQRPPRRPRRRQRPGLLHRRDAAVAAAAERPEGHPHAQETSPEDLRGMIAAEGILTTRGGASSHAALVARQMGKVCVCGAHDMDIDYGKKTLTGATASPSRRATTSRSTASSATSTRARSKTSPSQVIQGLIENKASPPSAATTYKKFVELMKWADKLRKLGVRTNSDTPEQVRNAIKFGAEGIGLTRTEHMFFEGNRIDAVREMILADDEGRAKALKKLLPYQKKDFIGIFKALDGRPATIRLLDPPLHEFIGTMTKEADQGPGQEAQGQRLRPSASASTPCTRRTRCSATAVAASASSTRRSPRMQATAILEAAVEVQETRAPRSSPRSWSRWSPTTEGARAAEGQVIDEAAAEVRKKHGLRRAS